MKFKVFDNIEKKFVGIGNGWSEKFKEHVKPNITKEKEDSTFSLGNKFFYKRHLDLQYYNYIMKDVNGTELYEYDLVRFYIDGVWFDGYFIYHLDELRYEIDIVDWQCQPYEIGKYSSLSYNAQTMSNFVSLGTSVREI